jgi:photosystem II stability/assembly factor-like uncharacterized protein
MFSNLLRSIFLLSVLMLSGNLLSAQTPSYEWGSLKIGGGGYVTGIVVHPRDKNVMYIRTDVGGAYRWDDRSKQWMQMLNWVGPGNSNLIGVDGMALDAVLPDRVYMAMGRKINEEGGIYRSDDRGVTWTKLMAASFEGNGRAARWIGECIAVDPHNSNIIFAGTRKDGLWRSMDGGKTWAEVPDVPKGYTGTNPTGVRSVVFDPSQTINKCTSVVYVGIPGHGIYVSQNGGGTFAPMTDGPKNPARMQVVKAELFVSHDQGIAVYSAGKWTDITPKPDKNYVGLAVDEQDSRKIVVAQRYGAFNNAICRSENKGVTWQQINTNEVPARFHVDVPWWSGTRFSSATSALALVPGGSGALYYTDWFGIWYTPDIWAKSTDWQTVERGHEETVVLTLVSPPSGALLYSGMADVFGFRHDKMDGYPPKKLYPLNECFSIAVCEKHPEKIAVLGAKSWGGDQTQLITSADCGETWTIRKLPQGSVLGKIALSATDANHLVYVEGKGKAYYSMDGGNSWNECSNVPENLLTLTNIWNRDDIVASDMVDGSFYILREGILYASPDGADWKVRNKVPIKCSSESVKSVVTVPGRAGEIWVCSGRDGLWKSVDSGETFTQVTVFGEAKLVCWGAPAPDSAYPTGFCYGAVAGKWGLYRSVNMGESWIQINDDQHQFPAGVKAIAADRNVFGRVFAGSGGCGIYYGEAKN